MFILILEIFAPYVPPLLEKLQGIMLNFDNKLREANCCYFATLALGSLIERAPISSNASIEKFLPNLISAFEICLDPSKFSDNLELQYEFQGYLTTLISTCLLNDRFMNLSSVNINRIFNGINKSFEDRKDIYPEGIGCLGTLIQGNYIFYINSLQE